LLVIHLLPATCDFRPSTSTTCFVLCTLCFFLKVRAPTEIYPLPLHDALPIFQIVAEGGNVFVDRSNPPFLAGRIRLEDRKSTRLNSSHITISYAVFCLKK